MSKNKYNKSVPKVLSIEVNKVMVPAQFYF